MPPWGFHLWNETTLWAVGLDETTLWAAWVWDEETMHLVVWIRFYSWRLHGEEEGPAWKPCALF